jgi:hypothetical protein
MSKISEEKTTESRYRDEKNVCKLPRAKVDMEHITPSLWNLASMFFGMAAVWSRSRFASWMTLLTFMGMLANADKHQMEFKSVMSSSMIVIMSFLINYAPIILPLVRGVRSPTSPSES